MKGIKFSSMSEMETLQETCWRVSEYVIKTAKEGKKISKDAMEHNFERVLAQLEKMNLLKKD